MVEAGTRVLPKVTYLLSLVGFSSSPSLAEQGTQLQTGVGGSSGLGLPYRESLQFIMMCQNVERASIWQKVKKSYLW